MSKKNIQMAFSVVSTFFLTGFNLFSQSTVSTPIVGFQKVTVPVGLSTAGFPLLNSDILKTTTTSVTGSNVLLSGETNVGSKLTSGEPYYIGLS